MTLWISRYLSFLCVRRLFILKNNPTYDVGEESKLTWAQIETLLRRKNRRVAVKKKGRGNANPTPMICLLVESAYGTIYAVPEIGEGRYAKKTHCVYNGGLVRSQKDVYFPTKCRLPQLPLVGY